MNFQYFFTNKDEIARLGLDIGFPLYSIGHLIWLVCILAAVILLSGWYKKQAEPKRAKIRKFFAVAILFSEIIKDSIVYFTGFMALEYLPFHLCGLAIFAMLTDAFLPGQKVSGNLIAYAFMPGATAALLFCNWTEYPFLNFMNIHSFVFHGWILCYFVMRYRAGEIRPDYSGLWKTLCCLLVLVYPMFLFNRFAGTNFMFLNEASAGSPLVPLWNIFGEAYGHLGYILSVIALVIIVFHLLYVLYKGLDAAKVRRSSAPAK